MTNLNMMSTNFQHAHCSTWWKIPKNLKWEYNTKQNDISVYLDMDVLKGIRDKDDGKKKFLWLIESPKFNNNAIEFIKNNLNIVLESFEEIWTFSEELLKIDQKFKWCPGYGISVDGIDMFKKSKLLSMIISNKRFTEQQNFRYNFAIQNKEKIDLFGSAFKQIESKNIGLNDYMFSICVENDTYDTYFTEKILDCFATGTIPIYKGTKNICNHFNGDGIIFLDEINIDDLNPDLYYSKIDSIKDNFERVKQIEILDDWIFDNYINKFIS